MNKYFQMFLDDNDLKEGECFTLTHECGETCFENVQFRILDNVLTYTNCKGILSINGIMLDLLCGKFKPVKLPYKPKKGELYWFTNSEGHLVGHYYKSGIFSDLGLLLAKAGRCYRTKEEAKAHRDEDYKWLMSGLE